MATHGDIVRMLVAHFTGAPLDAFQRTVIDTAGVSVVSLHKGSPHVHLVNDTGGLDRFGPAGTPAPWEVVGRPQRAGGNLRDSSPMELGPVDRITADASANPVMRAFYLQARAGGELVTVAVEKQQVQLLSASILELLADLELETGQGPGEEAMALEEPVEPRWRAGKLSIGFDQDQNLFQLEIEEFQPELDEDDPAVAPAR